MRIVPTDSVVRVHEYIVREFAGTGDPVFPPGVRSVALLDSAVSRQNVGFQGALKYPDVHSNAAALMYGVCNNHPFFNGNKRTALLAGLLHLDLNGFMLHRASNDQLFETMRQLAAHELIPKDGRTPQRLSKPDSDLETSHLADWLRLKSRRVTKGERSVSYGRLYEILEGFGFRLGEKRNNKVEILKRSSLFGIPTWKRVYKVGCPGDGRTMSKNELSQVREALHLTEGDGIDSFSFYGEQTLLDEHVATYRSALRRLAKI